MTKSKLVCQALTLSISTTVSIRAFATENSWRLPK
jgi:hypothetical protein